MKKHVAALCAAALLASGIGAVPGTSSAAAPSSSSPTKKPTLSNEDTNSGTNPGSGSGSNGGSSTGGNSGNAVDGGGQTGNGGNSGGSGNNGGNGNNGSTGGKGEVEDSNAALIDQVIAEGMKYLGTPYLFGSNRSTTETFDCSDFVRWIYKEKTDLVLPPDSRQQGAFVKKLGTDKSEWRSLKRGDLMFFMTYKGSTAAAYKGINKTTERITHVALYLGNGKILHTYSNASGGVHVQSFAGSQWEHRFLFGGSVLTEKAAKQ
ncbi:C40 family peptidase [Cohnella sp.]|uniref:C40 family peptidase n=1 Tax=Cohnella sp. TaxID=1883426 RepID=UPI0035657E66